MKRLLVCMGCLVILLSPIGAAHAQFTLEEPLVPSSLGVAAQMRLWYGTLAAHINGYTPYGAPSVNFYSYPYTTWESTTWGDDEIPFLAVGQMVAPYYIFEYDYHFTHPPTSNYIWFAGYFATWGYQGVVEFQLPEAETLNAAGVTTNNFTARLNGLNAYSPFAGPPRPPLEGGPGPYYFLTYYLLNLGQMNVGLWDLGDYTAYFEEGGGENGYVNAYDFNNTYGGAPITTKLHVFEPRIMEAAVNGNGGTTPRADFNNVNVTAAVRRDLFGAGIDAGENGNFTGFILKSTDARQQVLFYGGEDPPELKITIVEIAEVTCAGCSVSNVTYPAASGSPEGFSAGTAVSFQAEVDGPTAEISIAFESLPENTVVYKAVGENTDDWIQIYPDNVSACITNVTLDRESKVLTFTIADNIDGSSNCDTNPAEGIIEDPVVVGSSSSAAGPVTNESSTPCFITTVGDGPQ